VRAKEVEGERTQKRRRRGYSVEVKREVPNQRKRRGARRRAGRTGRRRGPTGRAGEMRGRGWCMRGEIEGEMRVGRGGRDGE